LTQRRRSESPKGPFGFVRWRELAVLLRCGA